MNKSRNITKNIISVLFIVALLLGCMAVISLNNQGTQEIANAQSKEFIASVGKQEEKIITSLSQNDDFEDDTIIVVLDKYLSKINQCVPESFFGDFLKNSITDLTRIEGDVYNKEFLDYKNFRQIFQIKIPKQSKRFVIDTIKKIEKIPGILYVGPNYRMEAASLPVAAEGDKFHWGLGSDKGIGARSAWGVTTGNSSVRVGVIDSGIAEHPDLLPNLMPGWDFVNNNSITSDDTLGHGTHVAGIIGAAGARENGCVGVCPNVKLYPLQVLKGKDDFIISSVVSAITWAVNNNLDILNYSAGGNNYHESVKIAIANYSGLFICAAGNNNRNNDTTKYYPSDFSQGQLFSDRVISVGAIGANGNRASFSSYGATTVSIFAPGDNIISTVPTSVDSSGYKYDSGTSMATPFVTGTAALMLSLYDTVEHDMTREEISARIKTTILRRAMKDEGEPLKNLCVSGGRLDAFNSLIYLPFNKHICDGFGYNGTTYYWKGSLDMMAENTHNCAFNSDGQLVVSNTTLNFYFSTASSKNAFTAINGTSTFTLRNASNEIVQINNQDQYVSRVNVTLGNKVTLENTFFSINTRMLPAGTYTLTMDNSYTRNGWNHTGTNTFTFIVEREDACIAAGSLVTLADGSQVAVENLTGNESLLVWNMFSGSFDVAPILFIDSDPVSAYEVTELTFADGTKVKVIYEHGFFDVTLNKYVYLRNDAAQYIGHYFNKQSVDEDGNRISINKQLTAVNVYTETTTAWSPVTAGHLCYYVNGMLSMPAATEGFVNTFDVDPLAMKYDEAEMAADVAQYGLFTYEEFYSLVPVPEYVFNAFNGQYLKVAIGKGLITIGQINELFVKYAEFF